MIEYKNSKMNKTPELKIGDGKELKKFEWTEWIKLILNKEIKFTWTSNSTGGTETRMKNIALYHVVRIK